MSVEHLIATYGYLAVAIGTFLEGETVLVVAGFAAHRGYLALRYVVLSAFLGSLAGDQLYFFLGRKHGARLMTRYPGWRVRAEKVHRVLERRPVFFIMAFRFGLLYGFRTLAPFVIGMSRIPTSRFVLFNIVGAALWSVTFGTVGYLFGHALELLLGEVKLYERAAFLCLAVAGLGLWLWRMFRNRRATSARSDTE